jgi:hypothetical protein
MFDAESLPRIREAIREQTRGDHNLLDGIRGEVRPLASMVRAIRPRSATAMSLVASDGGNNKLEFDPFYVQLVRVVDSYGKELFFDVISPSTDTDVLSDRQFKADGTPKTPLGQLMADLGVNKLYRLSPMIPTGKRTREEPETVSPGWVLTYRDLCEWAVLYERIVTTKFGTDTLIVRDGFLRSKVFAGDLFVKMGVCIQEAIDRIYREDRLRVYLVGLAKHSQVLTRYRLAMAIEGTLQPGEPRYLEIPREMEAKAYRWSEYARGQDQTGEQGEAAKFVLGSMYFVRFGKMAGDPIWAIDLLSSQTGSAAEIFGYLLQDAIDGFPVPYYPRCLQRAHEHAQIVDFDLEILQDEVFGAVRQLLPNEKQPILDALKLGTGDVAARRYG